MVFCLLITALTFSGFVGNCATSFILHYLITVNNAMMYLTKIEPSYVSAGCGRIHVCRFPISIRSPATHSQVPGTSGNPGVLVQQLVAAEDIPGDEATRVGGPTSFKPRFVTLTRARGVPGRRGPFALQRVEVETRQEPDDNPAQAKCRRSGRLVTFSLAPFGEDGAIGGFAVLRAAKEKR